MGTDGRLLNRREFIKRSAIATAAAAYGLNLDIKIARANKLRLGKGKKVIVLGIDGMDPDMCEKMMSAGRLKNLSKLRQMGGFYRLGTSVPAHSPVAWANFITGANPGKHGIFSFLVKDPKQQFTIKSSIAQTTPGLGIPISGYTLPILKRPKTVLMRKSVPFWDYLDEAGIKSDIYLVPSNYPPSKSKNGNHRSLAGLGTTDLSGNVGTYHLFSEDGPDSPIIEKSKSVTSKLTFHNETASGTLIGPENYFLLKPEFAKTQFLVHRDTTFNGAVVEINRQKALIRKGQWSKWVKVTFEFSMPPFLPDITLHGICRFYLQNLQRPFKLYVSPINFDPSEPESRICTPENLSKKMVDELGLFGTLGFQEAFLARLYDVLDDSEYAAQSEEVLQERIKLFNYALENYTDGVIFFYFSSLDMQSHFFWWDCDQEHPVRSKSQAIMYHNHIKQLYDKMDSLVGEVLKRYGDDATIIVVSDHGFTQFTKFFSLNSWLRDNKYIRPGYCSILAPQASNSKYYAPDWAATRAFNVDKEGLYVNLKGREPLGAVDPDQREPLMQELIKKLESFRDTEGRPVIRKVYRTDQIYSGPQTKYAPDLVLGFHRGYTGVGTEAEGKIYDKIVFENTRSWSADHRFAAEEIPGVLFCNRPINTEFPSLVDMAPSILALFGLQRPGTMDGHNVIT
jgi:predicted AlkP superfamily phosphohydrolase/phosphomutase